MQDGITASTTGSVQAMLAVTVTLTLLQALCICNELVHSVEVGADVSTLLGRAQAISSSSSSSMSEP